jgi:anti-anti-sigma factor
VHGAFPQAVHGPTPCVTAVLVPGRLLSLRGRLDVHAAADVRMLLVEAVPAADGDLVLDLGGLTALDATGLGVLVGGHRRAQRAGRVLVLQDVTPAVGRLLLLTRLDKVLRTVRSVAVA